MKHCYNIIKKVQDLTQKQIFSISPNCIYTNQFLSLWVHFDFQNTARHVGWWGYMTVPGTTAASPRIHTQKWAITTATRSMPWPMGNELPRERMLTIQVNHKKHAHTHFPHKLTLIWTTLPGFRVNLVSLWHQAAMRRRRSYQSTGSRQGSLTPSPSQDLLPFISSRTNLRAALIWAKCSRHRWLQRASIERLGQ